MKKLLFLLTSLMVLITAASAQVPGVGNPPLGWAPGRSDGGGTSINAPVLLTSPDPTGAPGGRVINFDEPEFDIDDNGPTGTFDVRLGSPLQFFHDTGATTAQAALNALTNVAGRAIGDLFQWNGTNYARIPIGSTGDVLTVGGGGTAGWAASTSGAPSGAHYLVTTSDGTLTNEHVGQNGSGTVFTSGAGTFQIDVDSTVIRTTGTQTLAGPKTLSGGPIISGANSTGLVLRGASFDTTILTDPGSNQSVTIPTGVNGASFVMTDSAQTIGGVKTFSASPVLSTNTITGSGANTVTLFNSSDTVVGRNTSDTMTNKELTSPSFTNNATGFTMNGSGSNTFVHTWSPGATGQTITWTDPNGNVDVAYKTGAMTANGIAYGIGNNTISATAAGTDGQVLTAHTGSAPTWEAAAGGLTQETISASGSLTASNKNLIYINTSGGSVTLTLPDAASSAGKFFWFRRSNSANSATIQRAGADTIDSGISASGTSYTLDASTPQSVAIFSDGTSVWKAVKEGVLSLSQGGTGRASWSGSAGGLVYQSSSTAIDSITAGSAGQIPRSNGSGAPTWSTATYPSTAGTSGNVLTSDGTNWSSSALPVTTFMKRKAANTGRNTTTTVTDDPDLLFAVAANETWDFEIKAYAVSANATPDVKFTCTGPSGSTVTYAGWTQDNAGTPAAIAATAGGTTNSFDMGGNQPVVITISGTCTNGATPGNLSFQWSQNVSNGTNTTVAAGSSLTAIRR